MHGSILPVTIPSLGNPGNKSSPSGLGMGNCSKRSCPGARGAGQIENNFLLFLWNTSLLGWPQVAQAHYERSAYINLFHFAYIMTSAKYKSSRYEKCNKYALISTNCEIIHNNKWFTLFLCCINYYLMAFWSWFEGFWTRISVLDYLHLTLNKKSER